MKDCKTNTRIVFIIATYQTPPATIKYASVRERTPASVPTSANGPKASQRQKRIIDSGGHLGGCSQSVASFDGLAGGGSIASDMGDGSQEGLPLPEEFNEVLMALEMKTNGTVGCAYFVSATATLYLQEDTRITGFELVESLIFQAQPSSIIVPSRAPENLIDYLDRHSRDIGLSLAGSDDEEHSYSLRTVVSSEFSPDAGKQALSQHENSCLLQPTAALFTTAVEDAQNYSSQDSRDGELAGPYPNERNKLMQLGTCINLDNRVTLGCANALLRILERKRSTMAGSDIGLLEVRSIQTVTYSNCLFATADTLLALQIFRSGLRQGAGGSTDADKDARMGQDTMSIFDLFRSLALTSQGRYKLREIFVRPSTDLTIINARQDAVASLQDPANLATVATIRACLKKIKSVRPLLLQLKRGLLLPGSFTTIKHSAWSHLHDFCFNVLHIITTGLGALQDSYGVISKALSAIDSEAILRVGDVLAKHVDFQESKSSGRSTIATGVSGDLDGLKTAYSTLQVRLGDICEGYRTLLSVNSQDDIIGCIFHPQMGYLLVASAAFQARLNDQPGCNDTRRQSGFETWEEALQEAGLVYYKTEELSIVDAEVGDLAGQIIELEVQVFHALGVAVLGEEEALLRASDAVGEIDCIFALAAGAKAFHLSRPRMTNCNVLHIRKGRHLLRECCSGTFVPNNCSLAGGDGTDPEEQRDVGDDLQKIASDAPSAIVVTGPNHSGKRSFVPAEQAIVGITDKILTRIATRESVSRDESAFGVDLRQAAFSINFATRRSLVLIDEFGKGTATTDGAALFEALLNHFLDLGRDEAPKVLAATHFHEIFDGGGFEKHPCLGLSHMSVDINPDASRPEEKVKFLHVLRDGRSTESFGCNCAAMNGVAPSVVERASQLSRLLAQGASLEDICQRSRKWDIRGLQEKEDRVRLFLSDMAEALDSAILSKPPRSMLRHLFDTKATDALVTSKIGLH
ncbi:dna mismatch repair protein [Ophiostoma piceae UAMH 11346]|uniref:Dna mismatch repair protein n=1 Tax=Ophiostoma piceae (strain UAMH 11346) TaxID=1262450 RepID=S3BZ10_OPHP1|nr:dna mismatch repair protein [Ophiostoma piceae UAMH 11346]